MCVPSVKGRSLLGRGLVAASRHASSQCSLSGSLALPIMTTEP